MPVANKYATPSGFCAKRGLALATSGGVTEAEPAQHLYFLTGFPAGPAEAARELPVIAAIARADYSLTARIAAVERGSA